MNQFKRYVFCWLPCLTMLVIVTETKAQQAAPQPNTAAEAGASPAGESAPPTNPENKEAQAAKARAFEVPLVTVIGSAEREKDLPGSGTYLTTEDIRQQSYDDINRVLREVPGVYTRVEDGYGIFPNISLRGVDTTRSSKITMMEDGILTAPAPYSAPAAYYSPTTGRMSGIEVLKGSSQIRYGPHITGGVINYLSTPIPLEQTAYLNALYGMENEVRLHGYVGNTVDLYDWGRFGFLVEGYFRRTDGFKTIDKTPDFRDSDKTGFNKIEPMVKLSWEPPTSVYNRFEFKIGYTDFDGDETYLGLSEADFAAKPYRRYSASRFDNIQTEHARTYLRHFIAPTENLDIVTTAYYKKFRRNWFKLNDLRNIPGVGNMDLSAALAGASDGAGLAVLKGEAEGTLRVRNNNRKYYLGGVESVADYRIHFLADHNITFGFRYHQDQERRIQRDELYQQAANGTIIDRNPGTRGDAGNRREDTQAVAFFAQDAINLGKWTITPGVRYEYLWLENTDRGNPNNDGSDTLPLVSGGVGVTYDYTDELTFLGSAYRGFSPPNPSAAIVDDLGEETSIATELGARYRHANGAFTTQVIGFYTYFDDLIVVDNIGGAGAGQSENVGRVDAYGVEFAATLDPGIAYNWRFNNPYFFAFTYTNAELASNSDSADPESIFAGGKKGNKVPYIPEFTFTIGTAVEFERFGFAITGIFYDSTYTSAGNTTQQINAAGQPDARFGKTDSYFIGDLSAYYQWNETVKVLGGMQNFSDASYIASRHPHGPRPGQPLFGYVGMEVQF